MATNTNPIRYINPIDLGGNELLNFLPEKLDAAPLSPDTGRMYYNTVDNKAYLWNGTAWRDIGSAPSISNVTVDNTHALGLPGAVFYLLVAKNFLQNILTYRGGCGIV